MFLLSFVTSWGFIEWASVKKKSINHLQVFLEIYAFYKILTDFLKKITSYEISPG